MLQKLGRLLLSSRFVVIAAVIASLLVAIGMFFVSTVDVVTLIGHMLHYPVTLADERAELRSTIVAHVVEAVDGYLLAAIMLIFSLGLYELFVSDIDAGPEPEAERVLVITSLDDLKDRLGKVVFLILVVKFFEYALRLPFKTPLDLLYLAVGIVLMSAALYLTKGKETKTKGTRREAAE